MKDSLFFFGNCNAGVARNAIERLGSVTDRFDLFNVRGDLPPSGWHPEISAALARCTLFFDQARTDNQPIREAILPQLPGNCRVIRFAPAFLNSLWPFVAPDPRNTPTATLPEGPYPRFLSNRLVLSFLDGGCSPNQAASRFLDSDVLANLDLDRLHDVSLAQLHELEQGADIRLADFIAANFQRRRLFLMPLHPAGGLFAELVRQMVREIGGVEPTALAELLAELEAFRGVGAYDAPVHPAVAAHFGLDWADGLSYRHFHEGEFDHDTMIRRHATLEFTPDYYDGLRLLDLGAAVDAYVLLGRAVDKNPGSRYFQRALAEASRSLGEPTLTVEIAGKGVEHCPKDGRLWLILARAAYEAGDWQLADTATSAALEAEAPQAEAWQLRAWVLARLGRRDAADAAARRHHWFRSQRGQRPLVEDTGAEWGRHWLGAGDAGF